VGGETGEFKQVLAGAICREIGARDFYRKIADSIRNAEGKERFTRLSGDEDGHRVKLEGWYEKLFGATYTPEKKELADAEIKGVNVGEKAGAMEALDLAIHAEMRAEEFYAHQAELVERPELKKLLEQLAAEEHGHYELLLAERGTLTGGFYWFDMDSSHFLED
jgi:rubrerythrin